MLLQLENTGKEDVNKQPEQRDYFEGWHQIIHKIINALNYTKEAFTTLIQLVNFIEKFNIGGAGVRWFTRYELFIEKKLSNPVAILVKTALSTN